MPAEKFFPAIAMLLYIAIIYFLAKRSLKRLYNPRNRVNDSIKDFFAKNWAFVCFKLFPIIFFIVQCGIVVKY
jgi:hypothetical protein